LQKKFNFMDFDERTPDIETNTQYKIMLGGYFFAATKIENFDNKKILDCACGNGYGSFYLSKFGGDVYGIDISEGAINYCKSKYLSENIHFFLGDVKDMPFKDNFFDAIVSQDTIEHIDDDERFLSEIKRVLKKNGLFIVFTPCSKFHNNKPDNPFHIREYSFESFENLLKKYFNCIEFYGRQISTELNNTEKTMDKIRKLPFSNLRKIIPVKIRHYLANLILVLNKEKKLEKIDERKDIIFVKNLKETPTIVAICK